MGRGRPRLYKTPEDKAAANRAKSMRSYYKYALFLSSKLQNMKTITYFRKRAALSSKHGTRYHADNSKYVPLVWLLTHLTDICLDLLYCPVQVRTHPLWRGRS